MIYTKCNINLPPPKLIEHLDKLRRRCLWCRKTKNGETSNSLAAWNLVCRPKKHGGLSVLDINIQNMALLLKFLHSYNKKDIPWCKLIWSTYYEEVIPHTAESCGSFWWRDLMSLNDVYRGIDRVNVGDGTSALFWKDLWMAHTLEASHLRTFSFTRIEDASIAQLLSI